MEIQVMPIPVGNLVLVETHIGANERRALD